MRELLLFRIKEERHRMLKKTWVRVAIGSIMLVLVSAGWFLIWKNSAPPPVVTDKQFSELVAEVRNQTIKEADDIREFVRTNNLASVESFQALSDSNNLANSSKISGIVEVIVKEELAKFEEKISQQAEAEHKRLTTETQAKAKLAEVNKGLRTQLAEAKTKLKQAEALAKAKPLVKEVGVEKKSTTVPPATQVLQMAYPYIQGEGYKKVALVVKASDLKTPKDALEAKDSAPPEIKCQDGTLVQLEVLSIRRGTEFFPVWGTRTPPNGTLPMGM